MGGGRAQNLMVWLIERRVVPEDGDAGHPGAEVWQQALEEATGAEPAVPTAAPTAAPTADEKLISVPLPCSRMTARAARAPYTYPMTSTSSTLRKTSGGMSPTGPNAATAPRC
jgi:hypothetical protein